MAPLHKILFEFIWGIPEEKLSSFRASNRPIYENANFRFDMQGIGGVQNTIDSMVSPLMCSSLAGFE